MAATKLVDGAWLQHIDPLECQATSSTTLESLPRRIGAGKVEQNHAKMYRDMIDNTSGIVPEIHPTEAPIYHLLVKLTFCPMWSAEQECSSRL
jgi:hypothetical protein